MINKMNLTKPQMIIGLRANTVTLFPHQSEWETNAAEKGFNYSAFEWGAGPKKQSGKYRRVIKCTIIKQNS